MGLFSLEKLFGVTIRESANDGSDFTNPDADYRRLFLGEDGLLHVKDSAGTVTSPYSTSGGISSGTSNPGSPSDGDLFYRSDLDLLIRYRSSGTRWVTTTLYRETMGRTDAAEPITAGAGASGRMTDWFTTWDMWVETWYSTTYVATTNNGSQFWTNVLNKVDAAAAATSMASYTTAADTVNNYTHRATSVGAVFAGASFKLLEVTATKTSTPGDIYSMNAIAYRLIIT